MKLPGPPVGLLADAVPSAGSLPTNRLASSGERPEPSWSIWIEFVMKVLSWVLARLDDETVGPVSRESGPPQAPASARQRAAGETSSLVYDLRFLADSSCS